MMVAGHRVFLAAFFVQPHPKTAMLPVDVRHDHSERGADAREGENQQAMSARSRRPTTLGPRTAAAGLTASTPTISQSNSMRTAASACLTPGGGKSRPRLWTQTATCTGSI